MTTPRSFRRQLTNRTFAVAALAAPLIALYSPLSMLPAAAATAHPKPLAIATAHPKPSATATAHPGTSATASPGPGPSATVSAKPPAVAGTSPHRLQLSIGVTDSRQRVQTGDLLTYAVKVDNIGKRNAPRLSIVQTLPAGLKLISASRHPAVHAGQLTWRLSLAAGHTSKFRVVGKVGKTPQQLLRLATIACATTGSSPRPIVCAAHSDELPAGAVAAAQASQAVAATKSAGPAAGFLRPAGAALVLVTAAGGGYLLFRRRQAGRRQPGRRAS
jgi:uncharacterized repeat protein (TIGR01451 family)